MGRASRTIDHPYRYMAEAALTDGVDRAPRCPQGPTFAGPSRTIAACGIEHRANFQRAFVGRPEDIDMEPHEFLP